MPNKIIKNKKVIEDLLPIEFFKETSIIVNRKLIFDSHLKKLISNYCKRHLCASVV